jgi:hypothetical protein
MESPEDPLPGFGFVVLNENGLADFLIKFDLLERFEKVTPVVAKYLGFDDEEAGEGSCGVCHFV